MSFIDTIRSWFTDTDTKERAISYEQGAAAGLTLEPSLTGISLNNEKALTVSAFYSAVRHIADAIASLPIRVMVKQDDGGKLADENHAITWLCNHEPNAYMNKADFLEWLMVQILLFGNSYCKLDILNSGRVGAMHPIQARFMQIS